MNPFYQKIGIFLHFFMKPFIYLILNNSTRTRVIICYQDQILLTKTWLSEGKWSLPGGGVRVNERVIEGALREVLEETGIKLSSTNLIKGPDYLQRYLNFRITQKLFKVNLDHHTPIKRQKYEISDIKWLKINELNIKNTTKPTIEMIALMK